MYLYKNYKNTIMKKVCIVLCLLIASISVSAQGLDFGIKAGVNFANLPDATSAENRTGFTGGIFAGVKFNDKVGIQADLLYSQQGAEFDTDKIDLNYVNVPVVLKYFLIQGLNIQAGPQFGFVVDDNVRNVTQNIADSESFDLTGIIGVGYDLPLGLKLEGRYNFGLTDATSENVNIDQGSLESKNSVITLSVGYSFL